MASISRNTVLKVLYWNAIAVMIIVCLIGASITRRLHAYDSYIVEVGRTYDVDPRLISAVIWRESRFDPAAVGEAGEVGLMQVTEAAGLEWAEDTGRLPFSKYDLFDPEVNIEAGTWYLARAIRNWSIHSDPLPYALAEYNAGRSNAERWELGAGGDAEVFWAGITYGTTKNYIKDILERYRGGL